MSNNKIFISVVVIFMACILGGFIAGGIGGYFVYQKMEKKNTTTNSANLTSANNIQKNKRYKQSGEITQINNDNIIIKIINTENNSESTNITVKINENTLFKKFHLSDPTFPSDDIKIGDLKISDTITALADDNIEGQTTFLARQINLYINN
jgi:hypothetical protein